MLNIEFYKKEIVNVCIHFKVKKLDIFGSATREDFNPASDIDLVIEFQEIENENLFDKYFEFKEQLEKIFNRPVDILIEHSIKNPFLKDSLEKTRKHIYAA